MGDNRGVQISLDLPDGDAEGVSGSPDAATMVTDPAPDAAGDTVQNPATAGSDVQGEVPETVQDDVPEVVQDDAPGAGTPDATAGTTGQVEPDAVCAGAVTRARQAALEEAGSGQVGAHEGVTAEGERLVCHYFECLTPGYRGWRWAVTVARAPRARTTTICEVVLLPGSASVLAPAWLPWADRVAPGDLGAADQLAYRSDDPNLEPGYTETGEDEEDRLALWELGLGRPRVLGARGRSELARRWYDSDRGPTGDEAVHARAACSTCGYFLPLAGSLRRLFGVCGNEWSPSDARVVSVDHGCGAHSETDLDRGEPERLPPLILDEVGAEAVVAPRRRPAEETTEGHDATAPAAVSDAPDEDTTPADGVSTVGTVETVGEEQSDAVIGTVDTSSTDGPPQDDDEDDAPDDADGPAEPS